MGQGSSKGPSDSPLGDEPARYFGNEMSLDEKKEFFAKMQNRLENYVKTMITKPSGEKNSPAKTCGDLFATYPEKKSGKLTKNELNNTF